MNIRAPLIEDPDLIAYAPPSRIVPPGTTDYVMDRLFPKPNPWKGDPVGWVHDRINGVTWSKTEEILRSLVAHRYTAVRSCHDIGKSNTAARATQWWLDAHKPGEAFVVTTAPTAAQVNNILWREIRDIHRENDLPGRVTLDAHQYLEGDRLVAVGRKPADHDQAAFQGIHSRAVLVVIDEACGVPRSLFDAADALVTNEHSRMLAIGNPDDPASHFAKVCAPGSGWNLVTVSAFDTPAFTGEKVPEWLLDLLISPVWVEERKKRWGEGSPIYKSKVLGEFPDISDDTLLPPRILRNAQLTDLSGKAAKEKGVYALDVARKGADENVLARNRAGRIRVEDSWSGLDLVETAKRMKNVLGMAGHKYEVGAIIDVVGLGAGVYDMLKHAGMPVREFNAANKAYKDHRFANRRAEVYWTFRRMCELGEIDLPADGTSEADDDLLAQLGSVKYTYDPKGRILIEPKEKHAKRLGHSPDRADAAVMTLLRTPPAGKRLNPGVDVIRHEEDDPAVAEHSITDGLMEMEL